MQSSGGAMAIAGGRRLIWEQRTRILSWRTLSLAIGFILDFISVYLVGIKYLIKEQVEKHLKANDLTPKPGKVAIVTGGSRGIGLEVVQQLLAQEMHVIMASSNAIMGNDLLKQLNAAHPKGKVEYQKLDLASMISIKKFAREFLDRNLPLHLLVNNAGIMFGPYNETEDGFESQLGINYLGHFFLSYLLLPRLKQSGTPTQYSRIVNVSSCCHFAGRIRIDDLNSRECYSAHGSYAQTKLAQVMYTVILQEVLQKERAFVTVNAVHPGIVNTKLYQHTWFDLAPIIPYNLFKTPEQGADTVTHVALSDSLEGIGGKYLENCQIKEPNSKALDRALQLQLWEETCNMLGIRDLKSRLVG